MSDKINLGNNVFLTGYHTDPALVLLTVEFDDEDPVDHIYLDQNVLQGLVNYLASRYNIHASKT